MPKNRSDNLRVEVKVVLGFKVVVRIEAEVEDAEYWVEGIEADVEKSDSSVRIPKPDTTLEDGARISDLVVEAL